MSSTRLRHLFRPARPTSAAVAVLLGAVLLTACGEERKGAADGADAPGTPRGESPPERTAPATSGHYVEPGAGDGAPHYRENNAHRFPGRMSAASEKAADAQRERVERVLKRLWGKGTWDPGPVRAALRAELGADAGEKLVVQSMYARWEGDRNVTPEGAMIGLRVRDDACVTAFVQKTNYGAKTDGPFPETGCMEPPVGH
ncbi:hypothetical protein [Streptomyces silvensis]|uniref:Lipoprotein n=1 Tax=Streptomyces silvensis TaxID=1765722 RepID=A0A0W7XAR2_9ACTN|nr:hypothetical protein [Streptomyces silvensis]KUF19666.1 hypothetical protein AT728_04710 [Streptomyces silvensis]